MRKTRMKRDDTAGLKRTLKAGHYNEKSIPLLFQALLKSPRSKVTLKRVEEVSQPVVIYIPSVFTYCLEDYSKFFEYLRRAVDEEDNSRSRIIVIATRHMSETFEEDLCNDVGSILGSLGHNPAKGVFSIFPIKPAAQGSLFEKQRQTFMMRWNIRMLQRNIRRYNPTPIPLLQHPYADWKFPQDSLSGLKLRRTRLDNKTVDLLAQEVCMSRSIEHITDMIEAHLTWHNSSDKWNTKLPRHAWQVAHQIHQDPVRFRYELRIFESLVNLSKCLQVSLCT